MKVMGIKPIKPHVQVRADSTWQMRGDLSLHVIVHQIIFLAFL